jgi:hypothetical protein
MPACVQQSIATFPRWASILAIRSTVSAFDRRGAIALRQTDRRPRRVGRRNAAVPDGMEAYDDITVRTRACWTLRCRRWDGAFDVIEEQKQKRTVA